MQKVKVDPGSLSEPELYLIRKKNFDNLASIVLGKRLHPLLLDHPIAEGKFAELEFHTRVYISACMNTRGRVLTSDEIIEKLDDPAVDLANQTAGGVLHSKADFTKEFNALHNSFSNVISDLGIDHLTECWQLPINLRAVTNNLSHNRPYASVKVHTDSWAGEPGDLVLMSVPVLGDIERTTIEWFSLPDDFGESHIRILSDFDDGKAIVEQASKIEVEPKLGHIYFSDCSTLHRTKQLNGKSRVSFDVRFRFKTTPEYKNHYENLAEPSILKNYASYKDWMKISRENYIVFDETVKDCREKYTSSSPRQVNKQSAHRIVEKV